MITRRGFFKAFATAVVAGKTLPLLSNANGFVEIDGKAPIPPDVNGIGRRIKFRRYASIPPTVTPLAAGGVPTSLSEYYDRMLIARMRPQLVFSEFTKISRSTKYSFWKRRW